MALLTAQLRKLGRVRLQTAVVVCVCSMAHAQMPIGSVSILDATVNGASSIANDRAQLSSNGTVVAKDHVAYVQLFRGGSVKVCATSGVHLTAGTPLAASSDGTPPAGASVPAEPSVATDATPGAAAGQSDAVSKSATSAPSSTAPSVSTTAWAANIPPPLMVALDRGAMELRMGTVPGDIVMTPDLRFSFTGDGQLDVHIRVTRNGDTCVENRIAGLSGHPELRVGSLFGSEAYTILPGQHVLFEGGSLHEVVDNESSPCGCPEAAVKPPAPAFGELSLTKAPKTPSKPTVEQHPFPADVSQGLAPPPPVPQAPPGVTHTQIATTLIYNPAAPSAQTKKDTPPPAQKSGFFHSIGRFFKRVF